MCSSLILTMAAALAAQAQAAPTHLAEGPPSAVHLVGHEDQALLRRVQQVIDDWDPRKLRNPYVAESRSIGPDGKERVNRFLTRSDLGQFIAEVAAAEALGKALFWEMRAGSDFQRLPDGTFVGTACASCHYRSGADARNGYTTRIPYVAWNRYTLDRSHPLEAGEKQLPFDAKSKATEVIRSATDLEIPRRPGANLPRPSRRPRPEIGGDAEAPDPLGDDDEGPTTRFTLIVGSQGVEPRIFQGLNATTPAGTGPWWSELGVPRIVRPNAFRNALPEWQMFVEKPGNLAENGGRKFRQITARNSPSVHNAVFSDRLFHDGRAESTFNGISIFGDFDRREILFARRGNEIVPTRVAISKAALASQAVGPIVNEVEMSYYGRTFHDLARKLLDREALSHQRVADDDSHLGAFKAKKAGGAAQPLGLGVTYRQLIRRAFRSEWWDGRIPGQPCNNVELRHYREPYPKGELMEANFSLYWGLSIMLYEASLVSNDAPFDAMMRGNGKPVQDLWKERKPLFDHLRLDRFRTRDPKPDGAPQPPLRSGTEVFQRGFRLFMNRGCVDCHSGPLLSEVYSREDAQEPKPPIGQTLAHALLPNSMADAIAFNYAGPRRAALGRVAAILRIRAGGKVETVAAAARLALELDQLRDAAGGREVVLRRLVGATLDANGLPNEPAREIAEVLMTAEKTLVRSAGDRHFFGEVDRLAMAELLGDPLLIERMAIPDRAAGARRPMPIPGLFVRAPYAFYDLGYYNLGVAPPRYDRGNGSWTPPDDDDDEIDSLVEAIASARSGVFATVRAKLAGQYALDRPEGKMRLADDFAQGVVQQAGVKVELGKVLSQEELAQIRADRSSERQQQAASGVRGNAYRLKRPRRTARPPSNVAQQARPIPGQPVRPLPNIDEVDRPVFGHNRDTSWFRDLPGWDRGFPERVGTYNPVDVRRSEVHLFSRSRALVQDEQPWGHRKPFLHDNELAFWGSFKTPTLRNVELTPPYMHNGRLLSLLDVIDFYDRGGDFPAGREINPDKHPAIVKLDLTFEDKLALLFFLMCLTDDRVRLEAGPFDHPSINLVNGYEASLRERILPLAEVGRCGHCPPDAPPHFPACR